MSFDGKYDDRLQKIREAAAAAIRQLDQLRSTEPTPRETLDAEVARIAQEKLPPLRMRSSLFTGRMMA
jgi:hypothetical protein